MNRHQQKGAQVSHTARSAKTPSLRTGLFASRSHLLRAKGTAAPSSHRSALLCAALLALTLFLAPSAAQAAHTYVFSGTPIDEGSLSPIGDAFNPANGDLYVGDAEHARLDELTLPSGALDTSFGPPNGYVEGIVTPWGVAIEASTEDVYVSDQELNTITRLTKTGSPAPFSASKPYISADKITGTATGENTFNPTGIAINPTDGNLYVADLAHSEVDVYAPTGEFLTSFSTAAAAAPFGLAIDSNGNVYVAGAANDVQRFASDGTPGPVIEESGTNGAGTVLGVGVNPATNDVFVAEQKQVAQFDESGHLLARFGQGDLNSAFQLSVDPATAELYVTDNENHAIEPFLPAILPDAETGEATELSTTTAKLAGTINAAEGPQATCSFQYSQDESFSESAPCEPAGPFSGSSPEAVSASLSGLNPSTTYHYRLLGENEKGQSPGQARSFHTSGQPAIDSLSANPTGSGAQVEAKVNPSGFDTHVWVQYGETEAYGEETAHEDIGAENTDQSPSFDISGLAGTTTYHYRLFAENTEGEVQSEDRSFETEPAAQISETSVSAITRECAVLHAQVNPDGTPTEAFFEYGETEAYGQSTSPQEIGSANSFQEVSEEVCGLQHHPTQGQTYHFRAVATNSATPPGGLKGPDQAFTTLPTIGFGGISASHIEAESAVLTAKLNPLGADTHYRFQYLSEEQFKNENESFANATQTLEEDLGEGGEFSVVHQPIEGLHPETAYVFRLVAHNSSGTLETAPKSFTTEAAQEAAHECPNERLREESNLDPNTERPYSTELPDCRAWEQVTPAYKDFANAAPRRFAADGSALFFQSIGSIGSGGAGGANFQDPYMAARTESGWQTTSLQAPIAQFTYAGPLSPPVALDTGENLLTLSRGGEAGLYRRSDAGIVQVGPLGREARGWAGASDDLSRAFFYGEFPGLNGLSLYEYAGAGNSEPELVGVRNVGTVAAAAEAHNPPYQHINEAAEPLGGCGVFLGMGLRSSSTAASSANVHNAISADGETAFFTVRRCGTEPPVSELYARLRREHTVPISEPSLQAGCTEAECVQDATQSANFRDAAFQGASADGKVVFFLSSQRLLDSAAQDPGPESPLDRERGCERVRQGGGCNLYAYDFEEPEDKRLIDLSAGDTSGEGPQVQGVAAVSEDGSHAYFVAKGVLTEEPNEYLATAQAGQYNLYAYDFEKPAGERLSFVAVLSSEDQLQWAISGESQNFRGGVTGPMQTTPDGRFLLFTSVADPTPDAEGEGSQIYRYDSTARRLVRISIGEGGFNDDGNGGGSSFVDTPGFAGGTHNGQIPNTDKSPSIADNGTVAFESRVALTPSAAEGFFNAYEYERGHVSLLVTNPQESAESGLVTGIDHSGRDLFINAPNRLLPTDSDTAIDIYDARAGGGFPAPPRPLRCDGEPCQPGEASPAEVAHPTSSGFNGKEEGPNSPEGPKRCRSGFVRKHGRCVRRKSAGHRHKRHTHANRRAGR